MSDTRGTATIENTGSGGSIPDQIRAIMGKKRTFLGPSLSSEAKAIYKAVEKQMAELIKAKSAETLGWQQEEFKAFRAKVDEAGKLVSPIIDKKWTAGAIKLDEARSLAEGFALAQTDRREAEAMLRDVLEQIGVAKKTTSGASLTTELLTRASKLNGDLKKGGDPTTLRIEAQMLLEDAKDTLGDAIAAVQEGTKTTTGAKTSAAIDAVRVEVFNAFIAAQGTEIELCKQAAAKISKRDVRNPEAAVERRVRGLLADDGKNNVGDLTSNRFDRDEKCGGLKNWDTESDEARIKNLRARAATAEKMLANGCKVIRDEIDKDMSAFVKQAKGEEQGLQGERLEKARAQFDKDFVKVETALAQLVDIGCPELKALSADAATNKKNVIAASAYVAAPGIIERLLERIEGARTKSLGDVKASGDKLKLELKTLLGELNKAYGKFDDMVKPPYRKLIDEAMQVSAVIGTGNPAALDAAKAVMTKVREAALGGSVAKIAALVLTAREIKGIASSSELVKEHESEANQILLALKTTFEKNLDLYQIGATETALAGILTDANGLNNNLAALQNWRKEIKGKLDKLEKLKKEFVKLASPGFRQTHTPTTLDLDFAELKDGYSKPGVDQAAMEKLVAVLEKGFPEILALLNSKDKPVADRGKEMVGKGREEAKKRVLDEKQEETEAKKKHAEVEKKLADYMQLLSKTSDLVNKAPRGDKETLSELTVLGKQVKSRLKSNDDDGALKQLISIQERLEKLNKFPLGLRMESVQDLQNVAASWNTALASVGVALDTVVKDATKIATDLSLDAKGIEGRVKAVKERLGVFRLTEPVLTLADEQASIGARKKAREQALKQLRAVRALIENDAMAIKLAMNPFGVPKPFSKMTSFLDKLEYNALRAVPPE